MCSLCGVLVGRGHWSEAAAHPEVFAARGGAVTRSRERRHRVELLNRVLAHHSLVAREWGNHYVLATRTGRTELVENLAELWAAAARLTGGMPDPLDPALLERLAGRP